ncbi:Asparagine synthetase domain-containing protein, partial [Zostera marina]
TIDLLNVSFDGVSAPDRISALSGLNELQRISSSRRWRLVEIDAKLSNLTSEIEHLKSLIYPSETYMDLNIGIALWLAANGEGVVNGNSSNYHESGCCSYKYKSDARILLVGSGADEQCAGYGRHRTKYKACGWAALDEEMKLDMHRIWKRNLGRDDRCISDHGKEARFPFLDEDVIKCLLEMPLWEIANLDEPSGKGDKKILREVAKLLGLDGAAVLPKRAIQISMANVTDGRVHTMITSAFSHMNTEHLIKNMIALYFFGNSIGNYFGPRFLLEMYIAGAVTGSIFYLANSFFTARSLKGTEAKRCLSIPGLGASGATNAILLFYIFCFPNSTVFLHFFIPVPAALVGALVIGTDLWRVKQGDKHVSGSCHLGGAFAASVVYAKFIKHWI